MTRIHENYTDNILRDAFKNREQVNKYGREVATGYKVLDPGDSNQSGSISQMRETLNEVAGQKKRVGVAMGYFEHQDAAFSDVNEILTRATEIAAQAANETNSAAERTAAAKEVAEIREQLISVANSTYLGRYIFAGSADNNPAYSLDGANTFTSPGDGSLTDANYAYSTNTGSDQTRSVPITNDLSVQLNQDGSTVFNNAIRGLTELTRALEGYQTVWTTTDPPVPNAAQSDAYTADEFNLQTRDIQAAMDTIESAREQDIITARTGIAGRMRRMQSAESLLDLSETSARDVLSTLQDADIVESASLLTEAQIALNASLQVSTGLLDLTILSYVNI